MLARLNTKIPPALLLVFAGLLLAMLPNNNLVSEDRLWLTNVIALLLGALALVIIVVAVIGFRRQQTTIDPRDPRQTTHLINQGIFAYSRNPIYLAFVLLIIAFGLLMNSVWLFIVTPAFTAYLTLWQIIPEEQALKQLFGKAYDDYSQQVRRWL
ncbi:isoprenylcysteine carboxylmethyltransferase family protein [Thalassotalea maritima]|uniref:methyltransferase family protein n=1 Tax=Thalassotalea maritima TaxID=3242416 RepID=UPI003529297B